MSKVNYNGLIINEDTLPIVENIADGLPGGFFIYHADGNEEFIYVNTEMIRVMGCETEDEFRRITGNSFRGLVYEEDIDAVEVGIQQQIKYQPDRMDRIKYRVISADGQILWIDETGRFVHTDSYGDVFFVFVIEVTDEHNYELQKKMERHLTIVDALCRDYLNVYLVDMQVRTVKIIKLDGYIIPGISKNAKAVYDYHTLWMRYIERRVHPEDADMLKKAVQIDTLKENLAKNGEVLITYRVIDNEEIHYFQVKFTSLDTGTETDYSVIVSFQNMDAVIEKKLADAKELADAKRALEVALEAADRANRAKTDFFFNLSHDIRTPMNVIIGFTNLLSKYEDDRERCRDYIQKIRESSLYLLELINNVLDMARIEKGKMCLEESVWNLEELGPFLQSVFSDQLNKKNLRFTYDLDIRHQIVWCDTTKMKEVFFNLISNAVKYTPKDGSVSMRMTERPSKTEGCAVFEIIVEDTGIGMSEEFLPHIFENFTRETGTGPKKVMGTGLGMPIVKKMLELMDGSIAIESQLGKGTKITVLLALKIADEANCKVCDDTLDEDGVMFEGKRILLAEDNALNAEIAFEILGEVGFEVEHAENGAVCVSMLQAAPEDYYDLILMDVQMPDMNGYEATREIRKLPGSRGHIPIIAMTANAFEEDKRNAMDAGMDGHVPKPIEIPVLLETISGMLK